MAEEVSEPTGPTVIPPENPVPPASPEVKPEKPKRKISLSAVLIVLFIVIVSALTIGALFYAKNQTKVAAITDFESCAAAGNPIMESYPEQCSANGQTFTRVLSEEEQKKLTPDPSLVPLPTLTASEAATWKTYTNSEYKFSINYPSDFEHKTDLFEYDQYNIVHEIFSEATGEAGVFSIDINSCDLILPPDKRIITEKIVIDGNELTKYYMNDTWTRYNEISVPDNQKFQTLCFTATYKDLSNRIIYEKVFDQMLSTFKFTE